MNVHGAQLQEGSGEDRLFITDRAVVVLDGATSHDPDYPSAHEYVDTLGYELCGRLTSSSGLSDVLAAAIESTAERLCLRPGGRAPSSTVAIIRTDADTVETLILGDSPAIIGCTDGTQDIISDERLDSLDFPESQSYREHLKAGHGYDSDHFAVLRSLQLKQRQRRNKHHGYWIAEADPEAAQHSIVRQYPADRVNWAILATDGAVDPLTPLRIAWAEVARLDDHGLAQLLGRTHQWEAETDPDGVQLPRSKRHDDKTIAVVRLAKSD
ncbi:PP2C family serine/threonine-protein phosphatase [Nocardia sp. NPDC024068]|uniref:PP2C family serine/threonine-protein phosphatase n=1 Tax=Nocardia sp. NPDC024068 TaxID=3157197 RepID=UPI00340A1571